ncbi:MAG: tetratricopeptide repeat protein [Geminicoccaceae bacterium]|nr:tetratricopeptide repeat protein [Geminicoccaceae bacterium]
MFRSPLAPRSLLPLALLLAGVLGGCATVRPDDVARETGTGPAQAARLVRMGNDALAAGDPGTAAGLYARALALEPGNREAARRLGEAALRSGRYQDAIEAYRRVLDTAPDDPQAAQGTAKALLALGRPEAALARLEEAVRARPDDPRLLNLLGVALDQLGRHEEARARYRAGLLRAPEDAALRNNLGLSFVLSGHYAEAIRELEGLARGPQSSARARHNLAAAFALSGDPRTAEELLRLDLPEREVRDNLAFYQSVRGLGPAGALRAARALLPERELRGEPRPEPIFRRPLLGSLLDGWTGREPARRAHRADAASVPASARGSGGIAADAPRAGTAGAVAVASGTPDPVAPAAAAGGEAPGEPRARSDRGAGNDTTGVVPSDLAPGGETVAAETRPAAPRPSPPIQGQASAEERARAEAVDPAPAEAWVIEVEGPEGAGDARARWQALRAAHPELESGIVRLDGASADGPLVLGPFPDAASAERICARLRTRATCRSTRL